MRILTFPKPSTFLGHPVICFWKVSYPFSLTNYFMTPVFLKLIISIFSSHLPNYSALLFTGNQIYKAKIQLNSFSSIDTYMYTNSLACLLPANVKKIKRKNPCFPNPTHLPDLGFCPCPPSGNLAQLHVLQSTYWHLPLCMETHASKHPVITDISQGSDLGLSLLCVSYLDNFINICV